jgi:hypothetical protein
VDAKTNRETPETNMKKKIVGNKYKAIMVHARTHKGRMGR